MMERVEQLQQREPETPSDCNGLGHQRFINVHFCNQGLSSDDF
jgi:hypothetical protein